MTKVISICALLFTLAACTSVPNPITVPTDPPSPVRPLATRTLAPTAVQTPSPTPFITAPAASEAALVPILMYHHIKDLAAGASELDLTWTVAPKNFQEQIEWLAQHRYQTITMAQLGSHLKERTPLPAKPIVITFDDGWVEGYTIAFPVLRKSGFIGTYFVYTQPLDRSALYLSWKQIEEMSAAGFDFEGHTITHPHLTLLSADAAMREISESKKLLEARLNKPVVAFAYPFGQFNNAVVDMVKRAGYESAVTIDPGYRQRANRIYQLQRIRISYNDTVQDLATKLPP